MFNKSEKHIFFMVVILLYVIMLSSNNIKHKDEDISKKTVFKCTIIDLILQIITYFSIRLLY